MVTRERQGGEEVSGERSERVASAEKKLLCPPWLPLPRGAAPHAIQAQPSTSEAAALRFRRPKK